MITIRKVEDSYQVSLKVEEKLERKKSQQNKGKIPRRGRGIVKEKFQKSRPEAGRYHSQTKRGGNS